MIARLSELLAALRGAGVPVGVREELRLRHALAALPEAPAGPVQGQGQGQDPDRLLRALLRSVLARTDEERQAVDRVLEAWLAAARPAPRLEPAPHLEPAPQPGPGWHRRRALWVLPILLVLLLPFVPWPRPVQPPVRPEPDRPKGGAGEAVAVPINPVTTNSSSGARVLRGGSFVDEPRVLRSAVRFRNGPLDGVWGWYFGFRCAWSPARQPRPIRP